MPSFRYQYGDRPLEGFTIQHGVGRGGFGEVYFAISDTGREVALKSVQQYEDIELRGIGHCMNLKSQHLVSIFDIRHSNNREPFVVMEYVNGPSLRDILDEAPHGLGTVKAVYLLREIAKGLSFLHQNGVVHRDLKPHNVFIEQGLVKIGDYSLSKIMTASHRSGHTVTVGTVHYMAPEIGLGRYDHTVDIYALGVMFYEILTGVPPFRGDSVGEVLMKHIAGDPELSHIAGPLADVIRKAMCKDPRQRYQSVDQMVDDVLSCAGVDGGLDKVSPDDLSMIAKREIQSASQLPKSKGDSFDPLPKATYVNHPVPPSSSNAQLSDSNEGFFYHLNRGLLAFSCAIGLSRRGWPDYFGPVNDPVSPARRFVLALFAVLVTSLIPVMFVPFESDMVFITMFVLIGGTTLVLLGVQWVLLPALESNATLVYRAMFGLIGSAFMIGASMVIADGWRHGRGVLPTMAMFSCVPLWLIDWRAMSSPIRPGRLAMTRVIGVGLLAIFPPGMWIIASVAVAVQLGSKYDPALSQRFGLSFPWLEHFLAAIKSLTRPRQPVLSKGVQYVQATSPVVDSPAVDSNPKQVETLPHVESPTKKEWEMTEKIASRLNIIPVNQYSAVIADSLVKAGGSLKRFAITTICLFVIGVVWLVWAASYIGVPTLLSNTLSPRELSNVEYFFGDSLWAEKVSKLPRTFSMLFVVPACIVLLKMRFANNRERGWQTVISFGLLAVSLLVLGEAFKFGRVWTEYGQILRSGENGLGVGLLLDQVSLTGIFLALSILIAGLFFLLIGFRSKPREVTSPNVPPLVVDRTSSVENQATRESSGPTPVENSSDPASVKSPESEVVI